MRTYKTWEAIKMLSENPKLRFKTTIKEHTLVGEREAEVIINGSSCRRGWTNDHHFF